MAPTRISASMVTAIVDTLIPAEQSDASDHAVREFFERAGSSIGIDAVLTEVIPMWPNHVRTAVAAAVDLLGDDFAEQSQAERELRWRRAEETPETTFGATVVRSTALAMFYTMPDENYSNPAWDVLGFSGPLLAPPSPEDFPKTLRQVEPDATEINVDAVVVGSGAGGGVAAAKLAAAGLSVLVIEKGSYRNEPDLPQLEALAFPNLYLEAGFVWTADGSAGLLAGSTVGGGTVVNAMACLATPQFVRREWADRGMEGVDGDSFDRHVEAVMTRINATPENTQHNIVNRLMIKGFDEMGLSHDVLARNAKDNDDRFCGECYSGCLVGCKQSTMITFLQDASDSGAGLLANCTVDRIVTDDAGVSGVEATLTVDETTTRQITVNARTVMLAAGAIATPLILQASSLGGAAAGENLHIHPSYFLSGIFDEEINGWGGQILTSVCHDFDQIEQDHGFLLEAAPMSLGFWTGLTGWQSGRQHKEELLRLPYVSGVWGFLRDHGGGSIRRDEDGRPLLDWTLHDDIDITVVRECHVTMAKVMHAAGAKEIYTFLRSDPRWSEGEDFDAFLKKMATLEVDDILTLSAHQTGSCSTGTDPQTSVVDGRGQVHGVAGLYVADASALPTAPGVNPMVSIEAFAHRTAEFAVEAARSSLAVS